jgi:release factor glutamine methyltransferase
MEKEKVAMDKNVADYEPAIALFVPDKDPLLFYKKIASFGLSHLAVGGHIYVEINEALGKETSNVFKAVGYITEIKKDLQGKDRMIKARRG